MGALGSVSGPRREPGTGYQAECLTHTSKNTPMGYASRDKDLSLSLRPFITPLLRHSVTLKG
jgi:hypothetical protein